MLSTMYTDTSISLAGKSRLMFITHRTDRYTELDEVKRVIAGGCDWIQLRVKNGLTPELAQAVSHYVNGCEGCCCCLDDNLELALQTGFHCVHLGKHDMPVDEARKRVREAGKEGQFLIGATANTFEDIVKAVRARADYIGLGPYRFTTTNGILPSSAASSENELWNEPYIFRVCASVHRSAMPSRMPSVVLRSALLSAQTILSP